jgi:hypothetical protein
MGTSALIVALVAASSMGASIPERMIEKENRLFQHYWGTGFVWKFDELPTKGSVPSFRMPYSGYIYPDRAGGTASVLRKYDIAYNGGRLRATAHERWDTTAYRQPVPRRGLFGWGWGTSMGTPAWHGHCNGWAAAAIRHAEPQKSVRRNGVTFTPADIKALLAEIYLYNDNGNLAGIDDPMNAGAFHAIMANWIGRGAHPLGMEADPGREKWNYPIYGFSSSSAKRGDRRVEVKMNLAYVKDTNGEYHQAPRIQRIKYFHYLLELNEHGEIIGGYFYRDSSIIDMLWVPLRPRQGGREGNESGNPYVDVEEVMAIWRESVSEELRRQWPIIDPPKEDRLIDLASTDKLIPVQSFDVVTPETPNPEAEEGQAEAGATEVTATDTAAE